MADLQETLKELIARDLAVSPEDVTPNFVREWLEKQETGDAELEFRSYYGGYHGSHLRRLTHDEIKENRHKAQEFLRQFSH